MSQNAYVQRSIGALSLLPALLQWKTSICLNSFYLLKDYSTTDTKDLNQEHQDPLCGWIVPVRQLCKGANYWKWRATQLALLWPTRPRPGLHHKEQNHHGRIRGQGMWGERVKQLNLAAYVSQEEEEQKICDKKAEMDAFVNDFFEKFAIANIFQSIYQMFLSKRTEFSNQNSFYHSKSFFLVRSIKLN